MGRLDLDIDPAAAALPGTDLVKTYEGFFDGYFMFDAMLECGPELASAGLVLEATVDQLPAGVVERALRPLPGASGVDGVHVLVVQVDELRGGVDCRAARVRGR